MASQPFIALRILVVFGMVSSVNLHDQLLFQTNKINDITPQGILPEKFKSIEPGFCNRREPQDEKACGHFCSERRKRTPSGTVEELGTKVFQDFSSTATSYCKFRVQEGWASVCLFQGIDPGSNLVEVLSREAGVQILDPLGSYEKILRFSRKRSMIWGIAAYIIIFCVLFFRYGWPLGGFLILPCLLSSFATLALLGWLGLPFHLIHILGLLLVLSFGVDYAIFFGEAVRKREPLDAAAMAIILSAGTTILSFALFLLCHSPVLRALGFTVSFGISLVFIGTAAVCGLSMNRFENGG